MTDEKEKDIRIKIYQIRIENLQDDINYLRIGIFKDNPNNTEKIEEKEKELEKLQEKIRELEK